MIAAEEKHRPPMSPPLWVSALLLLGIGLLTTLPGIGGATLWDIDEGLHVTCALEMHESNNWITPTFNYKLFSDKPVLMYWLQRICFAWGGIHESMGRLPMALATLLTLFLTAWMAADMAPRGQKGLVAMLAGLVVATSVSVVASARFANPDALLTASVTGALAVFWHFQSRGSAHWLWVGGFFTGLGMLAKGPIGVAIPCGVIFLFLVARGRWRELFHPFVGLGVLVFCAVAVPWYAYVGVETHFEFLREFFFKHNVGRFSAPMESHSGPIWYYLPVLLIGFAPWSILLTPMIWNAWKSFQTTKSGEPGQVSPDAWLFMSLWAGLVLGFFSITATKLPNYIMPAFPPLACLTALYLSRVWAGTDPLPRWVWPACYSCLALVGIITIVGLLIAAGTIPIQGAKMRTFPGLEVWSWMGLIPLITLGAMVALKRGDSQVACLSVGALAFTASLGLWNGSSLNPYKAPNHLAEALPDDQLKRDVNLCTWGWFQPSIVFYCRREVRNFQEAQLAEIESFLASPRESYLFTTEPLAQKLRERGWTLSERGRHYDFYKNVQVGAWQVSPPGAAAGATAMR